MESDPENKRQPGDSQSGGFRFEGPVTGGSQTFIDGDVRNLNITQGLSADELVKLESLFQPLKAEIAAAPPEKREPAGEKIEEIHDELAKGKAADPTRLNELLDALVAMVPGALSALVSMFANPILGALVGPATKAVLDHLHTK
jgi:hypothetical protein